MSGTPSQIEYYARALRAPRISDGFRRLRDQARDAGWSHEEYLAAVLSREVAEREACGAATRIKAVRFPAHGLRADLFISQHTKGLCGFMGMAE
jgi:DNA replication protein DnaC